jgi:hypothetical protein
MVPSASLPSQSAVKTPADTIGPFDSIRTSRPVTSLIVSSTLSEAVLIEYVNLVESVVRFVLQIVSAKPPSVMRTPLFAKPGVALELESERPFHKKNAFYTPTIPIANAPQKEALKLRTRTETGRGLEELIQYTKKKS